MVTVNVALMISQCCINSNHSNATPNNKWSIVGFKQTGIQVLNEATKCPTSMLGFVELRM